MNGISVRQTAAHRTRDILDAVAGGGSGAVNAVGHGESRGGAVGVMDGVGVHVAGSHRTCDFLNAATVLTIGAVRTIGTVRAGITLWALQTLGTLLAIMQHKGVGARGVSDGHHRTVTGRKRSHNRRETIRTVGAIGAVCTGRALRTVLDGESVRTIHIRDGHFRTRGGSVGGHRGRNAVLTIHTIGAVGAVMYGESGGGSIRVIDGVCVI